MPETLPFVFCNSCVAAALKESEKAQDLYSQVVESYRLPDCQKAMEVLAKRVPSGPKLGEKVARRLGGGKDAEGGLWLPDAGSLEAVKGMALEYVDAFEPWVDLKNGEPRSPDFLCLLESISQFAREHLAGLPIGMSVQSRVQVDGAFFLCACLAVTASRP
ncbi:MAG: hypothetical protein HYX87_07550 [Chloroflexi bacterium]|nr:hypothetical protein [Chloroflexota bacterium]